MKDQGARLAIKPLREAWKETAQKYEHEEKRKKVVASDPGNSPPETKTTEKEDKKEEAEGRKQKNTGAQDASRDGTRRRR